MAVCFNVVPANGSASGVPANDQTPLFRGQEDASTASKWHRVTPVIAGIAWGICTFLAVGGLILKDERAESKASKYGLIAAGATALSIPHTLARAACAACSGPADQSAGEKFKGAINESFSLAPATPARIFWNTIKSSGFGAIAGAIIVPTLFLS